MNTSRTFELKHLTMTGNLVIITTLFRHNRYGQNSKPRRSAVDSTLFEVWLLQVYVIYNETRHRNEGDEQTTPNLLPLLRVFLTTNCPTLYRKLLKKYLFLVNEVGPVALAVFDLVVAREGDKAKATRSERATYRSSINFHPRHKTKPGPNL